MVEGVLQCCVAAVIHRLSDSLAVLLFANRSHGPNVEGHLTTHPPHAVQPANHPNLYLLGFRT